MAKFEFKGHRKLEVGEILKYGDMVCIDGVKLELLDKQHLGNKISDQCEDCQEQNCIGCEASYPVGYYYRKIENVKRLSPGTLGDIKKCVPMWTKQEELSDEQVNGMSNDELFETWLSWNGILGYDVQIKKTIEDIYNVKLEG